MRADSQSTGEWIFCDTLLAPMHFALARTLYLCSYKMPRLVEFIRPRRKSVRVGRTEGAR